MFPLPLQNVYMFMEVFFPDTIYVSVTLRVELIFSERKTEIVFLTY